MWDNLVPGSAYAATLAAPRPTSALTATAAESGSSSWARIRCRRRSRRATWPWARYLEDYAKPHYKAQTLREAKGAWGRYPEKPLGSRCLQDITRNEVAQLQASISFESGTYAANDAIRLLRRLLAQAGQWGLLPHEHNPVKGLEASKEASRERYLSDDEHRRLHQALAKLEAEGGDPDASAAGRFLLGGDRLPGGALAYDLVIVDTPRGSASSAPPYRSES